MNNVWTENLAGLWKEAPTNYHENTLFGLSQFIEQNRYTTQHPPEKY